MLSRSLYAAKQTHDKQTSQSQCYQTIYIQPKKKHTTSTCHNHSVIKQFICSQINTRPANVTITMLANRLYAVKQTHQQISQSYCYKTIKMQPNKHLTSKCHNHNVNKQFIISQTNTRPAYVTSTILSNSLQKTQQISQSKCYQRVYTQPNKHTTCKCHNRHNVVKLFICSQKNICLANVTLTMLSNRL